LAPYLWPPDRLLQEEVTAKEDLQVQTWQKIAALPFAKTIEEHGLAFLKAFQRQPLLDEGDPSYAVVCLWVVG
jgi:hypothetical protein